IAIFFPSTYATANDDLERVSHVESRRCIDPQLCRDKLLRDKAVEPDRLRIGTIPVVEITRGRRRGPVVTVSDKVLLTVHDASSQLVFALKECERTGDMHAHIVLFAFGIVA